AEDGIRDFHVTGVQTCALPIFLRYHLGHDLLGPGDRVDLQRSIGVVGADGDVETVVGLKQYELDLTARFRTGDGDLVMGHHPVRSEERRVGKECRSGWSSCRTV